MTMHSIYLYIFYAWYLGIGKDILRNHAGPRIVILGELLLKLLVSLVQVERVRDRKPPQANLNEKAPKTININRHHKQ